MTFKHQFYQHLAASREVIFERLLDEVAPKLGMRDEWRGDLSLTGTNSARPAYLRSDIIRRIDEGARSKTALPAYVERIRELVKETYGDTWDAASFSTCEAALWACFDVLATPPLGGRGESYRTRYVGLYEPNIQHHLAHGRPFPPRYKDIFADRTNTAGELGIQGRRQHNLDVIIVPVEGALYEVHGIKPFVVPMLIDADPTRTKARVQQTIERHVDMVSAICTLGFDTPGFGYGRKSDGETPDLCQAMGELARAYDVPYIVDKARGLPLLGYHPEAAMADVTLYSMDKVAGALMSGLAIGREEVMVSLRRVLGVHSERFGGGMSSYGKGALVAFDPGREALVSQVAALEWIQANGDLIRATIDQLYDIVTDEFAGLSERYPGGLSIAKTYDGFGVEINYTQTWNSEGFGIPIFSIEDEAAGMNLIVAGLGVLGLMPPACAEGNIIVTPTRGMQDEDGTFLPDRARVAVRGLAKVLETLADAAMP